AGNLVQDVYCFDLMDIANGSYPNENSAENTGIFAPGDVVHYFLGARNTSDQWSYWHRALHGQGDSHHTTVIDEAAVDPCEWSVLPDAGRENGDLGDILYVDDADDRGGPAQLYFDWAFRLLNLEERVDRYDILDSSALRGNSLASRVQNIQNQIIGDAPEIYQKILWNSGNRESGLLGDGDESSGGTGPKKSDDCSLLFAFLDSHPDNPGVYAAGDDMAEELFALGGAGAVSLRSVYINFALTSPDHEVVGEPVSPVIVPNTGMPIGPPQMIAYGGCPIINDFDVMQAVSAAQNNSSYSSSGSANSAVVIQATPNNAGTTARFVLSGFGFNHIRDDVPSQEDTDRAVHLRDILQYFENIIQEPVGVDAIAFANELGDAYPNPFNPSTRIRYSIKSHGHVSLMIYNAAGQLVRSLVNEVQSPRKEGFSVVWDGTNNAGHTVSSGVYFYKLTAPGFAKTKKLVLLK
ncbi:MAG: T9SS type A sorting domain-containing protein, partial [Candidatus Latescibacterota bacterium]